MNVLPFDRRVEIVSLLVEGCSTRSIERLLGVHHDTTTRFALRVGSACSQLHDNLVHNVAASFIEIDEIWTFVAKKQARLVEGDSAELGDQYMFVAMDAESKLVLSYLVGKRTLDNAKVCLDDVRSRVVGRPQITTDGFSAYVEAVEHAFGDDVDFAMLVAKDQQAAMGSGYI
jgi:transposase-like protein